MKKNLRTLRTEQKQWKSQNFVGDLIDAELPQLNAKLIAKKKTEKKTNKQRKLWIHKLSYKGVNYVMTNINAKR